jgi:DNA polymerase III subunit gamma/tau
MSYVVMARKYRPQVFEEVIGQEHITTTLINAIKSKRLAHCYLFAGPRGTGKTTTARILAKALNCKEGIVPLPCNVCDSCKEISLGKSIDVFEMDAASKSKVDDIRELIIEGVKYAPVKGRYKIYIIDEVQMLSTSAFDALLKTIEEPPKNVIFIFATTEPQDVPPTILSRCQRFDFKRVFFPDLVTSINNIAEKEKIKISEDALYILARKADGSVRDAQSLLDQVIAYGGTEITKELVEKTLGIVDQEILFELTDIVFKKDAQKGLSLLNQLIDSGTDILELVKGLLDHLRNLLVARIDGVSDQLFDMSKDYIEKYKKESKKFSESDILRMINILTDLSFQVKKASEPRIHLEVALMKMIKMEKSVNLEEVIKRLDSLCSGGIKSEKNSHHHTEEEGNEDLAQKETQPQEILKSASTKDINLTFEDIRAGWDKVLGKVKKVKVSLWPCLIEGKLLCFEEGMIKMEYPNGKQFHKQQVEKRENLKLIQKTLEEIYGFPLGIKFTLDTNKTTPVANQKDPYTSKKSLDLEKIKEEEPLIKSILENFEGEII